MRRGEMAVRPGLAAWVRNEKEPSGRVHGLAREDVTRSEGANQRENVFLRGCQWHAGQTGQLGGVAACRGGVGWLS
jgi:hypothetical protein